MAKLGRPKLPKARKKSCTVQVCLTAEEFNMISGEAEAADLSLSAYMRVMVIRAVRATKMYPNRAPRTGEAKQ